MIDQPFHEGEIAVQERAGERDIARRHGVIIASRIPPGALTFLAQQRLIAVSVAGDEGHLWTTVWCGQPGFVHSADGQRLRIRSSLMTVSPGDPYHRGWPSAATWASSRSSSHRGGACGSMAPSKVSRPTTSPSPFAKAFPTARNTSIGVSSTTCLPKRRVEEPASGDTNWTRHGGRSSNVPTPPSSAACIPYAGWMPRTAAARPASSPSSTERHCACRTIQETACS